MKLENFNNKVVKITDIDDQTFVGICFFNRLPAKQNMVQ